MHQCSKASLYDINVHIPCDFPHHVDIVDLTKQLSYRDIPREVAKNGTIASNYRDIEIVDYHWLTWRLKKLDSKYITRVDLFIHINE